MPSNYKSHSINEKAETEKSGDFTQTTGIESALLPLLFPSKPHSRHPVFCEPPELSVLQSTMSQAGSRHWGKEGGWEVEMMEGSMAGNELSGFASPPVALGDWGAFDSFAALAQTSMSSVCRCHGLFYVPTYCCLVSLLLQCLWTLFYYVESGKRQTAVCVCEAVMKLARGLLCLW